MRVEVLVLGLVVSLGEAQSLSTYEGREPQAGWRAAAAQRIEKIRKADLVVRVETSDGKPAAGAKVEVRMKRHGFAFGTAVAAATLLGEGDDWARYRKTLLEQFNAVVLENDLKWPQWEQNRQRALDALAWLRKNGIARIRGHNLVWPGWRYLPPDLPGLADKPEALRARILSHIEDVVSATRGQLEDWDVINEPFNNRALQQILGEEEMAAWFRKARELDPNVRLYLNDFSILSRGGNDGVHQNHYFYTARMLQRAGAPLDGIGMQGHFREPLTPPARVLEILDRFAALGKKIRITEFDIDTADEKLQADYTRDFLITVFSHPSVDGFLMWGFWEGRHWRPRAAMFRKDWTPKPNAEAWKNLVHRQWWTDAGGVTAGNGVFRTRGFLGDYEVVAQSGAASRSVSVSLVAAGAEARVRLNPGPKKI